mmetsp:Transcript_41373/g.107178  ORF Transcript_41373/g.107178 Transcript_41373/m.107178 type:complete len:138 (-) Transcript_41373:947-1360(-)
MEVEDTALNWWLLFILVDFVYYWFHRFSHEINVLWSAHSVHHSAEEYNLTTALRQGAAQQFGGVIFYYPLALFFSPSFFCCALSYQHALPILDPHQVGTEVGLTRVHYQHSISAPCAPRKKSVLYRQELCRYAVRLG